MLERDASAQWLGRVAALVAIYALTVGCVALLGGDSWNVRWFFAALLAATLFEGTLGRRIARRRADPRPEGGGSPDPCEPPHSGEDPSSQPGQP